MIRPLALAACLALTGCVSEMIYADRYSCQRVAQFEPGVTKREEVTALLGAPAFTVGWETTWTQTRSGEMGLRVTEISMSFATNGTLTSTPRCSRRYY